MSCNVEVGVIAFRAQLEMVFHHRPQRNACLRISALDRNHPCEKDVAGFIKERH
jgi:hypothetical protein